METVVLENIPVKLNKQQLEMLRLLNNPLPEADYAALKKQIVQILTKRLDDEMEQLEKQNNWTGETYEAWGKEHNRISTNK